MKYLIILGDGMADEPIVSLGNRTPLQAAHTPGMNRLAQLGKSGLLYTVPKNMMPGSEVANVSILGYDPVQVLEGRGSLEAAGRGIAIGPDELVLRCNLICIENGKIKNHSAGHIPTGEADELIRYLNEQLPARSPARFFTGVSYRHIVKVKGGDKRLYCVPPHDATGRDFESVLMVPEWEEARPTTIFLNQLTIWSQAILRNHPVNIRRKAEGKDPANSIWLWSPGCQSRMKPLSELYPVRSGAVIAAVDLIKGIGVCAGLDVIEVPGATGLYDTNYEGKAQAALEALKEKDLVYLHVEASDEAGHEGNPGLKVQTIEDLDSRIVQPLMEAIATWTEPVTIALLPDHPTPCRLKTHTSDPVPFVIYKPGEMPDFVMQFDEYAARQGAFGLLKGNEFMNALFG